MHLIFYSNNLPLTLTVSGDKATVLIKGTSAVGAAIDLKMECGKITTMNNIGK
jgi:hypothetical protein